MARVSGWLGMRVPANRVHRRVMLYWAIQEFLLWGGAILLVRWLEERVPLDTVWWGRVTAALIVIGVIRTFVMPPVRYQIHRWETSPETVCVRDGLLRISLRISPLSRIQSVDVRRGPLELMLGLASVIVTTASSSGPLAIVGVDRATAFTLSQELDEAAQRARNEAT